MDPYTPLGCIFSLGHDSFICFETLLRLSHRCRKVCWCMSLFLLSDIAAQVITVWNCLSPPPHVHPGLLPNFISPILLAEHNSTSLCIYDSREIGQKTSCGDSAASGEHVYEPPALHRNPFSARGKWLNGPWSWVAGAHSLCCLRETSQKNIQSSETSSPPAVLFLAARLPDGSERLSDIVLLRDVYWWRDTQISLWLVETVCETQTSCKISLFYSRVLWNCQALNFNTFTNDLRSWREDSCPDFCVVKLERIE